MRHPTRVELCGREHGTGDVWLSSGQPDARRRMDALGGRMHYDWSALDTVTNFSALIPRLRKGGVRSVWLITSEYHMPRARLLATIMLGASGIARGHRAAAIGE